MKHRETGETSAAAQDFLLRTLPFLANVVIQDGIYWIKDYPNHEVSRLLLSVMPPTFPAFAYHARQWVTQQQANLEQVQLQALNSSAQEAFTHMTHCFDDLRNQFSDTAQRIQNNFSDQVRQLHDNLTAELRQAIAEGLTAAQPPVIQQQAILQLGPAQPRMIQQQANLQMTPAPMRAIQIAAPHASTSTGSSASHSHSPNQLILRDDRNVQQSVVNQL